MAKSNTLAIAIAVVFAALLAVFLFGMMIGDRGTALSSTLVGRAAPAVTQETLGTYPGVTPETLTEGEVTIVNFWASWCLPCRAEHPRLLALAEQGIRQVGINYNDQTADALKYLNDEGNPFDAIAFDQNGQTAFGWGVSALPETFILGPDGTVLFKFSGPLVGDDYDQRFAPELAKALAANQSAGQ